MNILSNDGIPLWDSLLEEKWFAPLKDCPQDKIWHSEGNVYIHTRMVAEALNEMEEYHSLSAAERKILMYAAVFHDISKPECTFEDNGRIVAPRHARAGEKVTRQLLWDADFEFRESVCGLVRLHGVPLWALDNDKPGATVISSSLRIKNQWLYLLAKADVLGRICPDQEELLEKTEYFRELCIEKECYYEPGIFHNDHSRFQFFLKEESYPAQLFDDTEFTVTIMSGLPGSGKDTWISKNLPDLPVVSLDSFRLEYGVEHGDSYMLGKIVGMAYEKAKEYARQKQSFIWNATNLSVMLRNRFIRAMLPYNPRFHIVYLETTQDKHLQRRKNQIPEKEIRKMQRLLELPVVHEVHEVSYFRT